MRVKKKAFPGFAQNKSIDWGYVDSGRAGGAPCSVSGRVMRAKASATESTSSALMASCSSMNASNVALAGTPAALTSLINAPAKMADERDSPPCTAPSSPCPEP